ncbi:hypothetical protein C8R44DRAFT_870418 [Mycena epipterygia]|nr:hypothetical protein C8R44DRAFT_870418 [Mycena epipterygia]
MTSSARVPTELLDEIVGHFRPDSDHETLKHLNLTSWSFHTISRPLLFATFNFHPYSVVTDTYGMCPEHLILQPGLELERVRRRLEFWSSEEIAPYVLYCNIEPLEFENSGRQPPPEDPYTLLTTFFEFLPRFANLRDLYGFTIHFTRVAMASLCALPKLTRVSIDMCIMAPGEQLDDPPPKSLKLETLQFCNNQDQIDWWLQGLCPDSLRVLAIDMSQSHDASLFDLQSELPSFPNVYSVHIVLGSMLAPRHLIPLSKFPGVEDLTLTKFYAGGILSHALTVAAPPELGGAGVCPLLKQYAGPHEILHILPMSGLRQLTLDPCAIDSFLVAMQSIPKPISIVYLEMTAIGSVASLDGFSDLFPHLNFLLLTVNCGGGMMIDAATDSQAYAFLNDVGPSLPQHLVKLAINFKFDEGIDPPDLEKLKDGILAQRPTLKTLWIHSEHFVYVWAEMPDGVRSRITGGPGLAVGFAPDFTHFFWGYWRTPTPADPVLYHPPVLTHVV